jgi:hypothetical protein
MRLTALRCSNRRCGLVLFAGLGFAIQACPCCHRPMETIGQVDVPLLDFNGDIVPPETAQALIGSPQPGGGT